MKKNNNIFSGMIFLGSVNTKNDLESLQIKVTPLELQVLQALRRHQNEEKNRNKLIYTLED